MKGGTSPVSEADIAVDLFLRETCWRPGPTMAGCRRRPPTAPRGLLHAAPSWSTRSTARRAFLDGRDAGASRIAVVEDGRAAGRRARMPGRPERLWATGRGGSCLNGGRLAVEIGGASRRGCRARSSCSTRPRRDWHRALTSGRPIFPRWPTVWRWWPTAMLDASFVKPNSHDWDLAAADLILREAGGQVARPAGAAAALRRRPCRGTACSPPAAVHSCG